MYVFEILVLQQALESQCTHIMFLMVFFQLSQNFTQRYSAFHDILMGYLHNRNVSILNVLELQVFFSQTILPTYKLKLHTMVDTGPVWAHLCPRGGSWRAMTS